MLKVKETNDLKNYNELKEINLNTCSYHLYYGTRLHLITCNEKQRQELYEACNEIILFAKNILLNETINKNVLKMYRKFKLIDNVNSSFLDDYILNYNPDNLNEYTSIYVTNNYYDAVNDTFMMGNTLVDKTYHQCIGFKDFNVPLDKNIKDAIKTFKKQIINIQNSKKVVFVFDNVSYDDLFTLNGENIKRYIKSNLYYCKPKNTKKRYKSIVLKLNNTENYIAHIVHENQLKNGFKYFYNVKNVDEFLYGGKHKRVKNL